MCRQFIKENKYDPLEINLHVEKIVLKSLFMESPCDRILLPSNLSILCVNHWGLNLDFLYKRGK